MVSVSQSAHPAAFPLQNGGGRTNTSRGGGYRLEPLDKNWVRRNSSLYAVELHQIQGQYEESKEGGDGSSAGVAKVQDVEPPNTLRLQAVALATSSVLHLQRKVRDPDFIYFVSHKYKEAHDLLLAELGQGDAKELEAVAASLQESLDTARLLLVTLLFNRDYWHRSVPGGGLHTLWSSMADGFDGTFRGAPWAYPDPTTGESVPMPGFDGIPYGTLRKEIVDAWRTVQADAKPLAALVQKFADDFYSKIDGTPPDIAHIKAPHGTTQCVPEEFADRVYHHVDDEHDPESSEPVQKEIKSAAETLAKAQTLSKSEAEKLLPGVNPDTFARLQRLVALSIWPNRYSYFSYLVARHINACQRFDAAIETAIVKAGATPMKAPFKSIDRVHAKVEAEYMDGPTPNLHRVTDLLRMGAVVKDHASLKRAVESFGKHFPFAKLKNRLAGPTHDVLAVFYFEGILVEVQFSYRTINLMKLFAHAAYEYSRINLDAHNGMEAILTAGFVGLPRHGPFYIGGYESMKPEQVQLKAVLV